MPVHKDVYFSLVMFNAGFDEARCSSLPERRRLNGMNTHRIAHLT